MLNPSNLGESPRYVSLAASEPPSGSPFDEQFPAKTTLSGVEPRGFEPLTSAVQNQSSNITRVCRCSKTRAKRCILCANISRLFTAVRAGWCTTVYKGPRQSTTQFSSSAFSLQNSTFLSGRCWDRTSDLCRVKSDRPILFRPAVSCSLAQLSGFRLIKRSLRPVAYHYVPTRLQYGLQ